jgi:hypothetical protein
MRIFFFLICIIILGCNVKTNKPTTADYKIGFNDTIIGKFGSLKMSYPFIMGKSQTALLFNKAIDSIVSINKEMFPAYLLDESDSEIDSLRKETNVNFEIAPTTYNKLFISLEIYYSDNLGDRGANSQYSYIIYDINLRTFLSLEQLFSSRGDYKEYLQMEAKKLNQGTDNLKDMCFFMKEDGFYLSKLYSQIGNEVLLPTEKVLPLLKTNTGVYLWLKNK